MLIIKMYYIIEIYLNVFKNIITLYTRNWQAFSVKIQIENTSGVGHSVFTAIIQLKTIAIVCYYLSESSCSPYIKEWVWMNSNNSLLMNTYEPDLACRP